eukprot:7460941-Karenia_brevis.AAC.1
MLVVAQKLKRSERFHVVSNPGHLVPVASMHAMLKYREPYAATAKSLENARILPKERMCWILNAKEGCAFQRPVDEVHTKIKKDVSLLHSHKVLSLIHIS